MDKVLVYRTTVEASKFLNDSQFREFYDKYFDYVLNGTPFETNDSIIQMLFISLKKNIDNASERYKNCVENGKKGGAPKGNKNAQKQPKTTENQPMGCFDNATKNNQETTKEQPTKQPKNNLYKDIDIEKDIEKEIDIDTTVTPTTSNIYNQSIHEIEKEKIEDTVTRNTSNHPIIPIFKNKEIPKMKELLLEYKDNEGELREPTHDELLCVAYIEDLGFSKDDFKDNNYTNVNQIILAVSSKVGKTLLKHGFKVSIDNKDYLDMLKNYLDANYNYFKISTSCF